LEESDETLKPDDSKKIGALNSLLTFSDSILNTNENGKYISTDKEVLDTNKKNFISLIDSFNTTLLYLSNIRMDIVDEYLISEELNPLIHQSIEQNFGMITTIQNDILFFNEQINIMNQHKLFLSSI
jgi:hypothetical protein